MAFGISATALFLGGTALVGGYLASEGASDAADTAAQASGQASAASIAEQRRQYDLNRADYAPYITSGQSAVNQLAAGLAPGGRFSTTTPFNFQYDQNTDPGTAFRFKEGMEALDRSAASKGRLMGDPKRSIRFGQELASQEYNNAFNRYVTGFNANTGERNQLYNRYAGVAGTGQQAVGGVTAQGANMAGNIGNAYMTSAANTGNAALAAAGQRTSAFGGAANVLGRMYGNKGFSDPFDGGGGGGFYDPSFGYNQTENFDYYGPGYSP
jgi:hypothetical protein